MLIYLYLTGLDEVEGIVEGFLNGLTHDNNAMVTEDQHLWKGVVVVKFTN